MTILIENLQTLEGVNWRRAIRIYIPAIGTQYAASGALSTVALTSVPDSTGLVITSSLPPGRAQARIDGRNYDFQVPNPDGSTTTALKSTNTVQVVVLNGVATTLTFNAQTTASIATNATAATVQSRLIALSNITTGDVVVTGDNGGPYTVVFQGNYSGDDIPQMSASTATVGTNMGVLLGLATAFPPPVVLEAQEYAMDAAASAAVFGDTAFDISDSTALGTGFDRTGVVDSSTALSTLLTTTYGVVRIPAGEYNLDNWVTPTHSSGDLTIIGSGRVRLVGDGTDFIKVTGGSVTVRDIEFDGFETLFTFNDNETDHINTLTAERVTFANSSSGGLIAYFATVSDGVLIDRLEVKDCIIHDCRQGMHFRGRAQYGKTTGNEIYNTEHYSIRFGKDWAEADWLGDYLISGNRIYDQNNPETDGNVSGHEADMIACFGNNSVICNNSLENLTSANGEDCEGIYLKSRQFAVFGNSLLDIGMDEGAIIVKEHPGETATYPDSQNSGTITGNTIRWREQRDRSIGINILRSNVLVSGNQIEGAGVNGIRLSWRNAYKNVTIEGNTIKRMDTVGVNSGGHPVAAILLFGYGQNIVVRNNSIYEAEKYGILMETNASGVTRYPVSDTPIGRDIFIENNVVIGSSFASSRGIYNIHDSSAPSLDGLRIVGNKISGFSEYDIYLAGRSGCDSWVLDRNEIADGTINVLSWPSTIYVGGFEWSVTDTLSSGSTTKTSTHTIPSAIAAKLTGQDVQVTPRSTWGSATKFWLNTVSSTTIQIAVDVAPGGSGFLFVARIALNRVITT